MDETAKATGHRIAWKPGAYSSHGGTAGGLSLFGIHYRSQRSDPQWFMRCELPGLTHQTWKSDSKDELKAKAEQILDAWLTKIGAFL